jgi:hypothetical protein
MPGIAELKVDQQRQTSYERKSGSRKAGGGYFGRSGWYPAKTSIFERKQESKEKAKTMT